jgi:hypothetical protein
MKTDIVGTPKGIGKEALHIGSVSSRFSAENMIDFGNFIRDNYHGVGAPKLISYNHTKYPHGTIEDIFVIWCCDNGY